MIYFDRPIREMAAMGHQTGCHTCCESVGRALLSMGDERADSVVIVILV